VKRLGRLLESFKQSPFYGKFGWDILWNVFSVVALGVIGIGINIIIGRFYGAAQLGVFNQVYAVYILLSQVAVGGFHYSVLKHVPQYRDESDVCNGVVSSALVLTLGLAALVTAAALGLSGFLGWALGSRDVAAAFPYVVPGLLFFALNKVLLAALNGYRLMKAYAVFQGLRYVLMLGVLVGILLLGRPSRELPLLLSGAEALLLLVLAPFSLRHFSLVGPRRWAGWVREHLVFGFKAFPSGVLTEVNTRVDILMLGLFTSDAVVGVYSLAAFVAEGVMQLPIVVRTNLNPIITRMYFGGEKAELEKVVRRGIRMFYWIFGAILLVVAAAYPLISKVLAGGGEFTASWPVLCILLAGMAASAGYLPFMMLLVQAGYPGLQTLVLTLIVVSNVALNALLIPFWGMYGSAVGTAIAFVLGALYLKWLARRYLGMRV
jgi:O-antigen/teichoic acid export membrane protein